LNYIKYKSLPIYMACRPNLYGLSPQFLWPIPLIFPNFYDLSISKTLLGLIFRTLNIKQDLKHIKQHVCCCFSFNLFIYIFKPGTNLIDCAGALFNEKRKIKIISSRLFPCTKLTSLREVQPFLAFY